MSAALIQVRDSTLVGNSPASQVFLNNLPTPPIAPRETLITSLIDGFNAQGINLDCLYLFASADLCTSVSNLFGNSVAIYFDGADVNGSSRFTADRGYVPQGASAYIETGFNPSLAQYFSRNSASFFFYLLNSNSWTGTFGNSLGTGLNLSIGISGGHLFWKINSGGSNNGDDAGAFTAQDGFYLLSRTGANAATLDLNGVQIASSTTASEAPVNATIQCSANNVFTLSALGFGAGMTPTQRVATDNLIRQTYLHGIGAV